jgi:hypothetical protein
MITSLALRLGYHTFTFVDSRNADPENLVFMIGEDSTDGLCFISNTRAYRRFDSHRLGINSGHPEYLEYYLKTFSSAAGNLLSVLVSPRQGEG